MKINWVGAEFLYADAQTGITKVTTTFRTFANAPKNVSSDLIIPVLRNPNETSIALLIY
jgi:hypothetical protein